LHNPAEKPTATLSLKIRREEEGDQREYRRKEKGEKERRKTEKAGSF